MDQIEASTEYTLRCGCHAVVAAGTGVQETPSMTIEERKRLVAETVAAVDGEVPVLAGVSYPSVTVSESLVDHAVDVGADGVLAMPPWGASPSDDAVVEYYRAVAGASDLPVLAYNNPSITRDMSRELLRRVATIDGVDYVKESSRDWEKIGWLIERIQHEGLADVMTTMDVLLPTLQAGGTGIVTPPPATVPSMEIYEAFEAGDVETAVTVQRTFGTFPPDEATTGLTAAVKAALEYSGVPVGDPRPPSDPAPAEAEEPLRRWLAERGVPTVE